MPLLKFLVFFAIRCQVAFFPWKGPSPPDATNCDCERGFDLHGRLDIVDGWELQGTYCR